MQYRKENWIDAKSEQFIGDSAQVRQANRLARGHYRKPLVIPETV